MPSKNCDFSKNCEKLKKSQFLLKLLKSGVREGRRVPSKNCDFCNFCDLLVDLPDVDLSRNKRQSGSDMQHIVIHNILQ